MANVNAPFGFSQYAGTGSAPTYEMVTGLIAYNTANIFYGDPVFRSASDGTYQGVTTGPGPGSTSIAGIFYGCAYLSVSQKRRVWGNYWPGSDVASTDSVSAKIVNDPNAQFLAQTGGSSSVGLTTASYGLNLQFAYGTGSTASGISGAYLDMASTTGGTTSTLPFRLVRLVTIPPGAPGTAAGAYNYAIVSFNNVETKNLLAV